MEKVELFLDGKLVFSQTDEPQTPPVDPPVDPPPSTGGSLDWPKTQGELRAAIQSACDQGRMCVLDPRTSIDLTEPITINLPSHGKVHGVNGNMAKLNWKGAGGVDILTFAGSSSRGGNRNLVVQGLDIFGNGYSGSAAGACLKLYAPDGDAGSIYKFKIADVYTAYGTRGIVLQGAVFEGFLDNVHAENHRSHGMETLHMRVGQSNQAIISNINIIHPNFSRNLGAGLKCTYSTNLIFGSFVNNALGGVLAPDGLRYAAGNNGENTGESLFVLGSNGYGSVITGNEVSSDGKTVARWFENGQWVTYGKPCLYLLDRGGATGVIENANHCSYYGSGTSPMRVVK